jgi:hypothetical protein
MSSFNTKATLGAVSLAVALAACAQGEVSSDDTEVLSQGVELSAQSRCDAIYAAVQDRLAAAQGCLFRQADACRQSVPGVCCSVVVADVSSAETTQYLKALELFDAACPGYIGCTARVCPGVTGSCVRGPLAPGEQPNPAHGVCESHMGI